MTNKPNKPRNSTPQPNDPKAEKPVATRKPAKGAVDFSIGARAVIRKEATWN